MDLGLGDADLFRDGGLGRPGHLHLEDLGASILCRQSLAVIQSHDLVTDQKIKQMVSNSFGHRWTYTIPDVLIFVLPYVEPVREALEGLGFRYGGISDASIRVNHLQW